MADPTPTPITLKSALDTANPTNLPDALKKVLLGTLLAGKKVTVSQAAAATITLSPPALAGTVSVRVTAGSAAAGGRIIVDAAGTPAQIGTSGVYLATLSDDGATLTFETTLTGAIVSYVPRPTDAELAALLYPST